MFHSARKTLAGVAVLAALALGGSALADAATNNSGKSQGSSSSAQNQPPKGQRPPGPPPNGQPPPGDANRGGPPGAHVGRNGQREKPLSGETAAKVKEAALAKVKGGTVERVETDADHGSPYEAHVRKSDGTQLEVLVNKDFNVTAVHQCPGMPR